jgi:uncharacterized protein (TIGR03435 family)
MLKENGSMSRVTIVASLAIWSGCAAWAQVTGATFEVASVKPSAPITDGRIMVRMRGGPGTPDPGQITYNNVSIKLLLTNAYNVKGYQISGPDWMESERFDITAKMSPDTTKEQFQQMLQNLLAERFHLKLHHQTKEMPMYALVVGKGGSKLKESVDDPAAATDANGPNGGGPGAGGGFGSGGPPRIQLGRDGFPQLPAGAGRGGLMMMAVNGKMRLQASRQKVSQLAEMLSNQLSRPVTDMTELSKIYDFTLDFVPDDGQRPMMGGMHVAPPQGADGGGAIGGGPAAGNEGGGPTIFTAVQEQLGLKLDARKGPVDLLVIDTLEKVPTEN